MGVANLVEKLGRQDSYAHSYPLPTFGTSRLADAFQDVLAFAAAGFIVSKALRSELRGQEYIYRNGNGLKDHTVFAAEPPYTGKGSSECAGVPR